jgi:hypothetical protein
MKLHIAAVACVAMCATFPLPAALAQSTSVGAGAAPAAPQPEPPKKPMSRKQARAVQENADARLCLEFPTQLMIVKCAEKYRLDKHET